MATKRKYERRVIDNQKPEENVIRITNRIQSSSYVRRALWLLQGQRKESTTPVFDTIVITAIDNAISKAVIIAEVVRRRVAGLYQINTIKAAEINEVYEPLEEGLVQVKVTKKLASLQIKLTKVPTEQDKQEPGFLEPLPADQIQPTRERPEGQSRGESRGPRGNRPRGNRGNRGNRRDNRDRRDDRDTRDTRDSRDNRDNRDNRERRDDRRDNRDNRENRERRDNRDNREHRERRDDRDGGERKERRDNRDRRDDGERRDNNRRNDGQQRTRGGQRQQQQQQQQQQ